MLQVLMHFVCVSSTFLIELKVIIFLSPSPLDLGFKGILGCAVPKTCPGDVLVLFMSTTPSMERTEECISLLWSRCFLLTTTMAIWFSFYCLYVIRWHEMGDPFSPGWRKISPGSTRVYCCQCSVASHFTRESSKFSSLRLKLNMSHS